jgi:hypothetical protein
VLPTSTFYSSIINRVFCEEKKKESLLLLSSFASCSIDVLTLSPWLRGAWPSGVRSQELHTGGDIGVYAHNLTTPANVVYLATRGLAGDFYGDAYFHNNITVAGDVILTGADCAEEFDIAEAAEIEPGTVVVLDQDGVMYQSQQAYDKRVAGVISGAGNYRPGMILDRHQTQDSRVPIALVGKVYCKVDAQYAPIEVGDLLTTSPTPGHAMKAEDPLRAFGSVIGKALRRLHSGQGLVPILVALQ